MKIKEIMKVRT